MQAEIQDTNRLFVLVVDDDRAISKLIKKNLEGKNTEVLEAASGLDCIKLLRQERIDLIILDIRLPDFSGWGILSLIRLTESLCEIPVIVVSVEVPNMALIKQFKPNDYIQKPFDMRDLLERVRRIDAFRSAVNS